MFTGNATDEMFKKAEEEGRKLFQADVWSDHPEVLAHVIKIMAYKENGPYIELAARNCPDSIRVVLQYSPEKARELAKKLNAAADYVEWMIKEDKVNV